MATESVFLLFLGFPSDVETGKRDPYSKRKPNRKVGISERTYNGAYPDCRGWRPGEPRKLTTHSRLNRSTGNVEIIFDAVSFSDRVQLDFGPDSDGWAHLPEKNRSSYGFKVLSESDYKKRRAAFEKAVAAERAEAFA